MNIFLVGFMGCGKSTIGKKLANQLWKDFVDVDRETPTQVAQEYLKESGEPGVYQVGITDYAQGELGDVVYVELPGVDDRVRQGEVFGSIEAVKAASDLFAPVSGEVVAVNEELASDPSLINSDPYGGGWMLRIRTTEESERERLLSAADYAAHVGESAG
jgi:glycine cleavage system H protein